MKPATVAEYIAALPEERRAVIRAVPMNVLHLMSVYGNPAQMTWLSGEFKKRGKKFDMRKSCLRFTSLDDVASTPMDTYIECYRSARKKTARGK